MSPDLVSPFYQITGKKHEFYELPPNVIYLFIKNKEHINYHNISNSFNI